MNMNDGAVFGQLHFLCHLLWHDNILENIIEKNKCIGAIKRNCAI